MNLLRRVPEGLRPFLLGVLGGAAWVVLPVALGENTLPRWLAAVWWFAVPAALGILSVFVHGQPALPVGMVPVIVIAPIGCAVGATSAFLLAPELGGPESNLWPFPVVLVTALFSAGVLEAAVWCHLERRRSAVAPPARVGCARLEPQKGLRP